MNRPQAILALDLGTTSAKALVVDQRGKVIGRHNASITTLNPQPGSAEQSPDQWITALATAARTAIANAENPQISAIAVTGQMHGTVLLNESGEVLAPAIIWSDQRAALEAAEIETAYGPAIRFSIGGPLASGYQIASLAWLRKHQPATWSRISKVLLPKDFVAFRLTGQLVTDGSDAVSTGLLSAETNRWDTSLHDLVGIERAQLPKIVTSGSVIGELTSEAAASIGCEAGTPVILAGGDAATAAIGAGVTEPSQTLVVLSTGAQVLSPTTTWQPSPDGAWHAWPAATPKPMWNLVGTLLNGGNALAWIREIAGQEIAPSTDGLLCLPYLLGERTDSLAGGAFLGLSAFHNAAHLHRAMLEGVALSLANAANNFPVTGERRDQIVVGGGGSRIEPLREILANVFAASVLVPEESDLSTYGAAIIAGGALGWPMPRPVLTEVAQPDQSSVAYYQELRSIFTEATAHLSDIHHRLGQLPASQPVSPGHGGE